MGGHPLACSNEQRRWQRWCGEGGVERVVWRGWCDEWALWRVGGVESGWKKTRAPCEPKTGYQKHKTHKTVLAMDQVTPGAVHVPLASVWEVGGVGRGQGLMGGDVWRDARPCELVDRGGVTRPSAPPPALEAWPPPGRASSSRTWKRRAPAGAQAKRVGMRGRQGADADAAGHALKRAGGWLAGRTAGSSSAVLIAARQTSADPLVCAPSADLGLHSNTGSWMGVGRHGHGRGCVEGAEV